MDTMFRHPLYSPLRSSLRGPLRGPLTTSRVSAPVQPGPQIPYRIYQQLQADWRKDIHRLNNMWRNDTNDKISQIEQLKV